MNKKIISVLAGLAAAACVNAADTALTHTINAGTLSIASQEATVSLGAVQELTATGVPSIGPVVTSVGIEDLRGASNPITIGLTLSPLTNSSTSKVRGTRVIASNATGDSTGVSFSPEVAIAEDGTQASEVSFVTATPKYNRFFDFDISITADAMSRNEAHAGDYTGTITLTAN